MSARDLILDVLRRKGPMTARQVFFELKEGVAYATVYRHLPAMEAAGLVGRRKDEQRSSVPGRRGDLWSVK